MGAILKYGKKLILSDTSRVNFQAQFALKLTLDDVRF